MRSLRGVASIRKVCLLTEDRAEGCVLANFFAAAASDTLGLAREQETFAVRIAVVLRLHLHKSAVPVAACCGFSRTCLSLLSLKTFALGARLVVVL